MNTDISDKKQPIDDGLVKLVSEMNKVETKGKKAKKNEDAFVDNNQLSVFYKFGWKSAKDSED